MWLRTLLVLVLTVSPLQGSQSQAPTSASAPIASPSARVAAVHFAIANGWQFPKTNVMVALETDLFVMHGRPVRGSNGEQKRFSEEIARLIGPEVKAEWTVGTVLDCPAGPRFPPCWAKKDTSVLYVSELLVGETSVGLAVYSPGARPGEARTYTRASIELERRDKNWIGVRYSMEPKTLTGKR